MKIVHIITRFVRGGADENTLLSCNAQAEAGHEVVLIHGRDSAPALVAQLHPRVEVMRAESLVREIDLAKDAVALRELKRLIAASAPDIVHTHTSKAGVLGRAAAWMAGCRTIVHGVHILPFLNVPPLQGAVYLALEHAVAPVTSAFVNVSAGMRDACVAAGLKRSHHVVPSGMDTVRFTSAKPLSDAELTRATGRDGARVELIVMAAALEKRKRVREFVEAFARIAAARPAAVLAVLGEGPERAAIQATADRLGLTDRVRLMGFQEAPERWMKRADVCVLSSEREGLPRVIVQYALCGRPIVTTALPGVEEIVQPDRTGFLVPVDDVTAMADPIIRLLQDRGLAARMAANARALDLSAWSIGGMASRLERIYDDLLKARTTGRGAPLAASAR